MFFYDFISLSNRKITIITFQDQIAHILPKTQDEPPIKYPQMITLRIHSTYIHWLIYPPIMYIAQSKS